MLKIKKVELGIGISQVSVSIMWLGGISCQSVLGMIFQWGSTLKVSIELPVTSRHRRDKTERLLKVTLSPNQTYIHILKNQTMLFPATFISLSVKIGVGLEKQTANFYFNFTRRWVAQYSCFDFFPVQNEGIFSYLHDEILI